MCSKDVSNVYQVQTFRGKMNEILIQYENQENLSAIWQYHYGECT